MDKNRPSWRRQGLDWEACLNAAQRTRIECGAVVAASVELNSRLAHSSRRALAESYTLLHRIPDPSFVADRAVIPPADSGHPDFP
jgi:hypothetical protein